MIAILFLSSPIRRRGEAVEGGGTMEGQGNNGRQKEFLEGAKQMISTITQITKLISYIYHIVIVYIFFM